jgi:hypothetical protein
MMSKSATMGANEIPEEDADGAGIVESISRTLDQCRTRMDELLVQIDLAKLDVREDVDHQLAVAQNAYLAARSKLSEARLDAASSVDALRQSLEQLLHDIGQAYAEVDAAVKRGA